MSDESKPKWTPAAQWLGRQLAAGPTPIVEITTRARDEGIDRAELAAALGAMPGVQRCEGSWTLMPAWREYWRGWRDGVAAGDEAASDARNDVAAACSRARREDRTRIQAILSSPECAGRDDLAYHLSFSSDIAWLEALGIMGAAARSDERRPPDETEDDRRIRITRLGELVGRPADAEALLKNTGISSAVAATLLAVGVDDLSTHKGLNHDARI